MGYKTLFGRKVAIFLVCTIFFVVITIFTVPYLFPMYMACIMDTLQDLLLFIHVAQLELCMASSRVYWFVLTRLVSLLRMIDQGLV